MAGPANIVIRIGASSSDAVSEINKVNSALGDQMTSANKASSAIKGAAVPAAAALTAVAGEAIAAAKAAADDAAAADKLAGALARTTGANKEAQAQAEDYISTLSRQTAIADDELRPALAKIAGATHDLASAQEGLRIATDVAAASGKPLASVAQALAKAYDGQGSALARMLPGIDAAAIKSGDLAKINQALADVTEGAASRAADTAAGRMKNFQIQLGELQESIGAGLLPVMQSLSGIMLKLAELAQDHARVFQILLGVVGGVAAVILTLNAALKVYQAIQVAATAATWLFNAALDANPIGAVIVLVVALGAALVVAYKKSETFRDVVQGALGAVKGVVGALGDAFDALKTAASAAWQWISDHWRLAMFAIPGIGPALALIASNFDKIAAAATAAWNVIQPILSAMSSALDAVVAAVQRLVDWLGKIHVPDIHLPHIPGLSMVAPAAPASRSLGASAASSAGAVTINVFGSIDPEGTARAIQRALAQHNRRMGR